MTSLPPIALSIQQPWAWAIAAGFKDIENRNRFAVTKGSMDARPLAIHASRGMTQADYECAAEDMARIGVTCPRPDQLVRGAIIGAVTVTAVVASHPSPWFRGPRGLVLRDALSLPTPIPAAGKLGYFPWLPGGTLAEPLPWMRAWPGKAPRQAPPHLFDLLENGDGP